MTDNLKQQNGKPKIVANDESKCIVHNTSTSVYFTNSSKAIPTVLEAAYMAQHVYNTTNEDKHKDLGKDFGGWILIDIMTNKEGLKMGVYTKTVDDTTGYALVNKGTSTQGDWGNNFQQPFGWSTDMKNSISKSRQFVKDHVGFEVTMVGHSKGGAEAVANAVASNVNCIIFNPAKTFLSAYGLSSDSYTANIIEIVVKGEALNTVQRWFSRPIDKIIYLSTQHTSPWWQVWMYPMNAIKNHRIAAVICGLKEAGYT
jgi:hypothetical protein